MAIEGLASITVTNGSRDLATVHLSVPPLYKRRVENLKEIGEIRSNGSILNQNIWDWEDVKRLRPLVVQS